MFEMVDFETKEGRGKRSNRRRLKAAKEGVEGAMDSRKETGDVEEEER